MQFIFKQIHNLQYFHLCLFLNVMNKIYMEGECPGLKGMGITARGVGNRLGGGGGGKCPTG